MATLLQFVLDEEVSPRQFISWLLFKKTDEKKLRNFEKERADFIPFFLNYLRDQSNKLIQTAQTSGLTPVKKFSLYPKVHLNRINKDSQRSKGSSRVELFPDPNHHQKSFKKQTHRESDFKNSSTTRQEPKSQQKMCLGQFINTSVPVTSTVKKTSSLKNFTRLNFEERNSKFNEKQDALLDFGDLSNFPPVGAVNTIIPRKREPLTIIHRKDGCKISSFRKEGQEKYLHNDTVCHSVNTMETISPSLDKITDKNKLDILIDVYSELLNENSIPNLSVELYFLIQLLTVRIEPSEKSNVSRTHELGNVHNCVYFASQVFSKHEKVLCLLDRGTLKLLADNPRLCLFAPELIKNLKEKCETNANLNANGVLTAGYTIGNVSFQSDTDNKKNFSNDQAFHTFRKDQFYETIREWEANHSNSEWTFSLYLGDKVKRIVGMWMDPIIYSHFAKLFISQLIATCRGNFFQNSGTSSSSDIPCELFESLKSDPEKIKRLQKRLITPARFGGPSPPPAFPGVQEFFRDFIVFAGCSMFNCHLVDVMVSQIYELNNTDFSFPENDDFVDEKDDFVDDNLRQQFTTTLLALQTLGKFLGLVTFLPYHTVEKLPQGLKEDYAISRNKIPLVIDVVDLFKTAATAGRLTLTVPFLVEFFSMMDKCGYLLPQVQEGLKVLIQFYKSSYFGVTKENFTINLFLLYHLLGWLFETPNFPSSFFFHDMKTESIQFIGPSQLCLDALNLINHQILYTCCPYLGELKVILADFAAGTGSRPNTIKKIVPMVLNDRTSKSNRLLQLQLEENFFHNQPTSVKKIVDFVAERLASNITKNVRKEQVSVAEDRAIKILYEFISENENKDEYNDLLKQKMHQLAVDVTSELKTKISQYSCTYCENQVDKVIELLMSEENSFAVIKMCGQIVTRQAKQNVNAWVDSHVSTGFFLDELKRCVEKCNKMKNLQLEIKPQSPANLNNLHTSLNDLSPTDVAIRLKLATKQIYLEKVVPNSDDVALLITEIDTVLQSVTGDWVHPLKKYFIQLSVEFLCGLLVLEPNYVTEEHLESFSRIWKKCDLVESSFPAVITSNLLTHLGSAKNLTISWKRVGDLLLLLLKCDIVTPQNFEGQCLDVLKYDWSDDMLNLFAQCLDDVTDKYKRFSGTSEFTELVEWLAWFCHQDDNEFL
uniref:Codanin-1 C-terminal domain-containing protein n=1 Tax=Strigamia maritima TaxID=126957 RepID=T1J5Z9_STRMM